jgi:hypothetical protein
MYRIKNNILLNIHIYPPSSETNSLLAIQEIIRLFL